MIRRLPRWVEVGGFWLAGIAGFVNAIGLLGFQHQAVSHLTGTSTLLGVAMVGLQWRDSAHLLGILMAFVVGAALSGMIINNAVLRLGRRYSAALLLEAGLLLTAMLSLLMGSNMGHFLASAACGLQNGMVSTYSGAIVRTTHVSGLFTDLGTMLGARLRGHALDRRRFALYGLLIAGFVLGGVAGAWGFLRYGFWALLAPTGAASMLAALYEVYRLRQQR